MSLDFVTVKNILIFISSARTISNQIGQDTTGKKWSWPQVAEAFRDPQLYFSFVNSFLANIPNGYVILSIYSLD